MLETDGRWLGIIIMHTCTESPRPIVVIIPPLDSGFHQSQSDLNENLSVYHVAALPQRGSGSDCEEPVAVRGSGLMPVPQHFDTVPGVSCLHPQPTPNGLSPHPPNRTHRRMPTLLALASPPCRLNVLPSSSSGEEVPKQFSATP